jgi:nucleoside 2-deoxyribosyltransferase
MKIYIIGALKNPKIPEFANTLTEAGFEAFGDWFAPGPDADVHLLDYAKRRGWSYKQALQSYAARHVFEFDIHHLDEADIAVMLAPCGKSGHLELGYQIGRGKPGFILFDGEPERFDVMLQFATDIFFDEKELIARLKEIKPIKQPLFVGMPIRWPKDDL